MKIRANSIDIEVEDSGAGPDAQGRARPVVLLIMGLGMQLIAWPPGLVQALLDAGYRVIRFDNRDAGLSQKFEALGKPKMLWTGLKYRLGWRIKPPYSLHDMAADALGVLDALQIDEAHVVGVSMGGMIAQIVAARYPRRTAGLGIIFSSNNSAMLPPPTPKALLALIKGPAANSPRDVIVENVVRVSKIIGSPAYQKTDEQLRADAIERYERCFYPQGIGRHFSAVLGSGSLGHYDKQITAPTVVIHGRADKLMRPSGGRAIADTIPGARLVLFDGMGHDLPEPLWDDIITELDATFAQFAATR